jgi:hypothetical protein
MSGSTWRTLLALVMAAHGIGHVLFLIPCLGIAQWGQSTHSWLLTRALGDTFTRAVGGMLWVAVIVGFAAASVGILGQHVWWRRPAIVASVVSLMGLILFAKGGNAQPLFCAGLMDLAVLVALLWVHWPSAGLVGA